MPRIPNNRKSPGPEKRPGVNKTIKEMFREKKDGKARGPLELIKTGEKKYPIQMCVKCESPDLVVEAKTVNRRWHYQDKESKGFLPALTGVKAHFVMRGFCAKCGTILTKHQIQEIAKGGGIQSDFKDSWRQNGRD